MESVAAERLRARPVVRGTRDDVSMNDDIKCAKCEVQLSEPAPNDERVTKVAAHYRSFGDPLLYFCHACWWKSREGSTVTS